MAHFDPWGTPQPCWHCTQFLGLIYGGSAASCSRGGVRAMPASGCAFWQREPGSDDVPDQVPASLDRHVRSTVRAFEPVVQPVEWAP
jgi:hypothetical protein